MRTRQVFTAYDRNRGAAESPFRHCSSCGAPLAAQHTSIHHRRCRLCGHTQYRNPAPGVVILIPDEERRVLLGRRSATSFSPHRWCLPGGYIEFDEDFLTAALREVREETGYVVEMVSILSVMSNFLREGLHTLVVVLEAHIIGGEPAPGDDISELGWYPMAGPFPDMAFEADHHIICRYHETGSQGIPVDEDFSQMINS